MNAYSYIIMENVSIKTISNFFKTISDQTRLKILLLLQSKNLCVNDIADAMKMEQSAISHQLIYLKNMNFVKSIKLGKKVEYALSCHHISNLIDIAKEHISKHGCK